MDIKHEKTLVLVKPDGVKRGLIGEIVHRIEQRGLKVVALRMFQATKDQMDNHYPKDEAWIKRLGEKTLATYKKYGMDPLKELKTDEPEEIGKMVREWLINYMTSAPTVKMIIEGVHAIDMVRKLAGNTMPALAEMGTVRGDFSVDSAVAANREKRAVCNIMHASENQKDAEHEIDQWFSPEEIYTYKRVEEEVI